MSLYRQYRPKSFADVVGQDHIVSTLEQAVKQQQLSHAYLFAGPRGTGKTSVARILAKILLTKDIKDEFMQKHIITAADDGSLVDLVEMDAASNRGIDDIRGLLEKIQFSPVVAGAKVYIIDEVHMLSREAFNALLKTLEEPPENSYFILATTELHKVPLTIQSRCLRFPFRQIEEEEIIRRIQFIADQEHISIDRGALRIIAHHVQGGMRDAIALLDQLRSLPAITSEDVKERIGETGHEFVEAMLTALEKNDGPAVLHITRKMEEAAVPLEQFLRLLLQHIQSSLHTAIEEKQSTQYLLHMLTTVLTTLRDLRIAPVPGLVVEAALLSLCTKEESPSPKRGLFSRRKEEPAVAEHEVPPVSTPEPTSSKAEIKEAAVEAPLCTKESLQHAWAEIVQQVTPPSVRMSLKNANIQALEEGTLTLTFSSTFHKEKVCSTETSRAIEEILARIFKKNLRLHCTLEEEINAPPEQGDIVNVADAAAEIF